MLSRVPLFVCLGNNTKVIYPTPSPVLASVSFKPRGCSLSSMGDQKIGMSRITAVLNERGGVCCWTVYSLLIGYKIVPGLDQASGGQVPSKHYTHGPLGVLMQNAECRMH